MNVKTAISNIPVLQSASHGAMTALFAYGAVKRFKKGKHLFFDKDEVNHIYFLVDGRASLYKLSNGQDKKVIFICGTGSLLNEEIFDGKSVSINCELLSDSYVLSFDRQHLLQICYQDFGLTKALMDAMSLKIRRLYRQMKNTVNSVHGDRRIAAKLWKLSKDHGAPCDSGTKIDFNLTITYLAGMLGSKRETVSRQLRTLSDRGLVIIHKNSFIIPDREKLKKYFYES